MPIVVKHEPNASAVLGLSQMAGEGAFNRWKTEFEARQKQYAFQNLMSGLSAGQSLAAPFINIAGQQAQRAFQSGEAAKARTWSAEQAAMQRGQQLKMLKQGGAQTTSRDAALHQYRLQQQNNAGIVQYERQRGDLVADRAKAVNGLIPQLYNMYGEGGTLSLQPDGSRRYPDHMLHQVVRSGDPQAIGRLVSEGMNAQRSTIQAQLALDPDLMERRIEAQVDTAQKTREMRYQASAAFQNKVQSDKNNPLSWKQPDGQGGMKWMSTDAEFAKQLNDHERMIGRQRLGLKDMPKSVSWNEAHQQITPYDFAVRDNNGNWRIQSISGGPNGRARRATAGSKADEYPRPGEEWTLDQAKNYRAEAKSGADKAYERASTMRQQRENTWSNRVADLYESHRQAQLDVKLEKAKPAAQRNPETLRELEIKEEMAGQALASERRQQPADVDYQRLLYNEQVKMYRMYGVAPPRMGHPGQGVEQTGDTDWMMPYGPGAFRGTQSQRRGATQSFLDSPASPTLQRFRGQWPGIPEGSPTWRQVGTALTKEGLTQPQIRDLFRRVSEADRERVSPQGPQYLQQPSERPDQPQPLQRPGLPPQGIRRPGEPGPQPTGGLSPRQYPPVKGPKEIPSHVGGPNLTQVAFDGMKKLHGVNDAPEILSIIRNDEIGEDLGRWVSSGKQVVNWPPLNNLYRGAERREAGRARRSKEGKPYTPPTRGVDDDASVRFDALAKGKGERAVQKAFNERRKMAAGIIQSSVKFSQIAGVPFDPSNIPAPIDEEFNELVRRGQVKAGDVIISPPSLTSDAQFMIVTQRMITESVGKGR